MHRLWTRLVFQQGDGGLPHAPGQQAGRCQDEAEPSEVQDLQRRSDGEAQHRLPQHPHPHEESGGEDKN